MNKISFFILTVFAGFIFTACEDYLDKEVDTNLTGDAVFEDKNLAPGFLYNIYNHLLPGYNRFDGAMLAAGSDEAVHSNSASSIHMFNNGAVNPSANPDDIWDEMYTGIRKTNIFLEKLTTTIAETNSIPENDRPVMRGEALFLRAMFHFELVKRYRNIPYVDRVLTEETIGEIEQLPFDAVVEKIVNDCDSAFVYLPVSYDDANKGRAVRAAAAALKSRLLLYAASPLNNPDNDLAKWERAAEAAMLFRGQSGPSIGLESNFENVFKNPYSREVILATQAVNNNAFERANFPLSYGGSGFTNPSQALADAFDTRLGNTIYTDPNYDPENPYVDRDPRFYATILHNGAAFKGRQIQTYEGGRDGLLSAPTATKTGYYIRKFIDPAVDLDLGTTTRKPWIIFRYSEAFLNYAEAMNEANGPTIDVYNAVFELRRRNYVISSRARYPQGMSQDEMRTRLKRERMAELALEEHRFWDLRRWKDAETELNKPVQGMRILFNEADSTYQYNVFAVENRSFDPKFYWYPIPLKEELKGYVEQNAGW